MVYLISGASHAGKTVLAQKLLEQRHIPYFSMDHLKMGLIRSGQTELTPMDDDKLVGYLWPIVREMIKTAIENKQSMIVEGLYIPFDWKKDFMPEYLSQIRYTCIVLSEDYIRRNFAQIKAHASDIEDREDDSCCTMEGVLEENRMFLEGCKAYGLNVLLIDKAYDLSGAFSEET